MEVHRRGQWERKPARLEEILRLHWSLGDSNLLRRFGVLCPSITRSLVAGESERAAFESYLQSLGSGAGLPARSMRLRRNPKNEDRTPRTPVGKPAPRTVAVAPLSRAAAVSPWCVMPSVSRGRASLVPRCSTAIVMLGWWR